MVSKEVISNQTVIRLIHSVQLCVKELEGTDFPSPNYRSEKLHDKLESRYGQQITFCKLDTTGRYVSLFVYNAKIKVETAIQSAVQLGSKNVLTEAASVLRETIISAFENSNDLR